MTRIPTLYLSRNGLLEPLGQSQIFAYLRGLSRDYEVTLITYEKDEDRTNATAMARARDECMTLGIRWLPQRFIAKRGIPGSILDLVRMIWLVTREVSQRRIELVHARSYIPAAAAWIVRMLTGAPFIFDMRALWIEELITAGRLRRGSWLWYLMSVAERRCLRDAAGVVSLTQAAVNYLKDTFPVELERQRIVVIPTCADLAKFKPSSEPKTDRVLGCFGTLLSGWFLTDWLSSFLAVAGRRDPALRLEITSRDDPGAIRAALGADLASRVHISSSSSDQMPAVLGRQIATVMFYTTGLGRLGSSPTRMAEALGCGIPVVTNDGTGEVGQIIRSYRVGVLAQGKEEADMEVVWDELCILLSDPELPKRCRRASEILFSLEAGTDAYGALYAEILRPRSGQVCS